MSDDLVGIALVLIFLYKIRGAGKSDLINIFLHLVRGHAETVIRKGKVSGV